MLTKVLKFGTASGVTLAIIRKARIICWTAIGVALLVRRGLSLRAVAEETQKRQSPGAPTAQPSPAGESR